MIRECKFDSILIQQFCPLPGTPVFDELMERREISTERLPSTFYLDYLAFARRTPDDTVYVTKELRDYSFRWLCLKEYFLLALRKPRFVIDSMSSGSVMRALRHIWFFRSRVVRTGGAGMNRSIGESSMEHVGGIGGVEWM